MYISTYDVLYIEYRSTGVVNPLRDQLCTWASVQLHLYRSGTNNQYKYNVRFQTIARSVHHQTVHVGMSSATSTACESEHEDMYIAWVAHTKTLYNGTSTVRTCKHNHGQDRYISRAGHAKTLYKGYKHSTHRAMVQAQYEYKHGQDR